jgi:ATP-dependent RNA helicase UAP56/SUB2
MYDDFDDELVDFEEEPDDLIASATYPMTMSNSGFKELLLKPELLRGVVYCGFEHPSEGIFISENIYMKVQYHAVPQAVLGVDLLCQAKSGMGKTAVFILSVLQQMEIVKNETHCIVLVHSRELAYQIDQDFHRLGRYLPDLSTMLAFGGVSTHQHREQLQKEKPSIIIGTTGRILELVKQKHLDLSKIKHFILDECDQLLLNTKMLGVVEDIFNRTPCEKQVMMFTTTLNHECTNIAKKFMNNVR